MTFALAWNDRRRPVAVRLFYRPCAQAGYVLSCPIATANRCAATAPHRIAQTMKQVAFSKTLR